MSHRTGTCPLCGEHRHNLNYHLRHIHSTTLTELGLCLPRGMNEGGLCTCPGRIHHDEIGQCLRCFRLVAACSFAGGQRPDLRATLSIV